MPEREMPAGGNQRAATATTTATKSSDKSIQQGNPFRNSLEAALAFHSRGWVPIPLCHPTPDGRCACGKGHAGHDVGKAPTLGAGYQNVRPDEKTIRHWFGKVEPFANVGILIEPSNLLFLGPDCQAADDYTRGRGRPETIIRRSSHDAYIYQRPEGCPIGSYIKQEWMDIKTNGYFVAYGWHKDQHIVCLDGDTLALAPDWLVQMLNENKNAQPVELPVEFPIVDIATLKVSDRIKQLIVEGKPKGERSEALGSVEVALAGAGYDVATIAGVVWHNPIGEKARDQGRKWLAADIARAIQEAKKQLPTLKVSTSNNGQEPDTKPADRATIEVWSHKDLMTHEFPERRWVVQDLVQADSLTMLGGKKKRGKSWMALQLCVSVASGAQFLGHNTTQGAVLYLALEDGAERLKSRLRQQNAPTDLPITYLTRFEPLNGAGMGLLKQAIEHRQPTLVIIDTLAAAKTGKVKENEAGDMADLANKLRELAQDMKTAIVVVAHHGKALASMDPGDDIRGSSAIAGAADCCLGLYKNDTGFTLKAEGRDIPEIELRIEFDAATTWAWHLVGDARQIAKQEADSEILDILDEMGEADAGTIARELGKSRIAVRSSLKSLANRGIVNERIDKRGKTRALVYSVPEERY